MSYDLKCIAWPIIESTSDEISPGSSSSQSVGRWQDRFEHQITCNVACLWENNSLTIVPSQTEKFVTPFRLLVPVTQRTHTHLRRENVYLV